MPAASEIYLAAVTRVTDRARTWSDVDATTQIPACPGWSAHDLVAHLAGGAADHATGRLDGFPGPAWTRRHIEERSSRTIEELVGELLELAPQTAARCDRRAGAPNSSWDAYIHDQDLAGAFGTTSSPLDDHGHELLRQMVTFLAAHAPFKISTEPAPRDCVQICVTDDEEHCATVAADVAFRAVTSRAGSDAPAHWRWRPTAPPLRLLEELSLF